MSNVISWLGAIKRRRLFFGVAAFAAGFLMAQDVMASYALEAWDMDARRNAPLYLKIWLGTKVVTNLCAVFFLAQHRAARWVLGALLVGHLWIGIVEATGAFVVQGGMVSLGHIVIWAPAIIALLRHNAEIRIPSAYGVWACAMLFFYGVSLIFDVRDATIWIGARVT